ncbi:RPA-interacting protein C-terminal domain-containing protein [Plasmodiophora brassicae]
MQQQQSPSGRVPLKAGRPLDEWRRRLRASCATRSRADRARFLRGLRSHPPDGSLSAAEIDQLIASLEFEFSQDVADQIHLAAYESSLPEIVGDFDYDLDHRGAYESILCPVCQRHHVAASAGTYSCPCGRFTLQVARA